MTTNYSGLLANKWTVIQRDGFVSGNLGDVFRHSSPEAALEKIERLTPVIRTNTAPGTEDQDVLRHFYLHDVWWGECEPGKTLEETHDLAMAFIDNDKAAFKGHERTLRKLTNLDTCISTLFGKERRALTVDLVKDVHRSVMDGLLDNAGEYRTKHCKPAQGIGEYLFPEKVPARLVVLLGFVEKQRSGLNLKTTFLLASLFLSEFLMIHPFTNGNGRTARLLFSLLLEEVMPVPFSFRHRDLYIRLLDQRMADDGAPRELATLLLYEADRFVGQMHWLLVDDE